MSFWEKMLTASRAVPHKHMVQEPSEVSPMKEDFLMSPFHGLHSHGLDKVCVAMGVTTKMSQTGLLLGLKNGDMSFHIGGTV